MLEEFSATLAGEIAPDEVTLAPVVARAFVAGGDDRAELFRSSEAVHGAMGFGLETILPGTLAALQVMGTQMLGLLTSPLTVKILDAIKSSGDLADLVGRLRRNLEPEAAELPEKQLDLELLQTILDRMPEELARTGIAKAKCSAVTLGVIKVLLTDPAKSQEALGELVQAKA